MLSYHYFKNVNLSDWVENLGYKPNILLDSGAYSAFTKNKNISLVDYINYINKNINVIERYVSLDVIGDAELSWWYWNAIKSKLPNAMPVFHYKEDEKWLRKYIEEGAETIALGGTVPIKNKITIVNWLNEVLPKYPNIKFHLLGSCSKKIFEKCSYVDSGDSASWIMMAVNGKPKEIEGKTPEAKIERAKYWMKYFDDDILG